MAQKLSNLPIGSKVKFGKYSVSGDVAQPIVWLVVAKNHPSVPEYPTNSVTLMTEKIIDMLAYDAAEPKSSDSNVVLSGKSIYQYSNIDQWLNKDSSAGNWYVPAHASDQAPTDEYVSGQRGYASRPAFLNAFSTSEKNSILSTTIRCGNGNSSDTYDITRKVFLPSAIELGRKSWDYGEGRTFEYFNVAEGDLNLPWRCPITNQLYNDTTLLYKPGNITDGTNWHTRTSVPTYRSVQIESRGSVEIYNVNMQGGVRPALNLPSSAKISDSTDADGCYTLVWNNAPLSPESVYLSSSIYGGKSNSISWTKVTDPDGDTVTYQLECAINNGAYAQIYSGTALTYAHLVPFGTSTVSYRVKAIDPSGESSAYTASTTVNVINNNAPVISGTDSNLGVKSDEFTGTYTITDANSDAVTVTEAIDGVRIRSLVATLGQAITYGITENTWLALPNGSHTLTISATDGIDTTVRTYVFTKLVDKFSIRNTTPWVSSTMPSRIMLVVTRNIPSTSTFKVEVCNNGYDASPKWEDATDAVLSGLVHVFSNKTKTATNWGVVIRVTVERNGAAGACYVSAIGGNFE